jgi:hypothetical protein
MVIRMLTAIFAMLVIATPPLDSPALHEKKRAYLQAQLDAARAHETATRVEGVALIGASVAMPFVIGAGALGTVVGAEAVGQRDIGVVAGGLVFGAAGFTTCLLSPYAFLVGLTRLGEVEDLEQEVVAREELLVAHEARAVRF